MKTDLPDGLYQVTTHYMCCGFVVKEGIIVDCADMLRKNIHYWATKAKRIGDAA